MKFVELNSLKGHEEVDQKHLEKLKNQIKSDGILKFAITVDRNTNVILDGHHRLQALKELGYNKIPAVFLDYQSPKIEVEGWRNGEVVTKDTVIKTALTGEKLPPKTSRHMINLSNCKIPIAKIVKRIDVPLAELEEYV